MVQWYGRPVRPACQVFDATVVALLGDWCYNQSMAVDGRWVLLAYRLPREPSTPRIALWRRLRQLGAVQLLDGLAALPLDSQTREQMEWLAGQVVEADGEARIWLGEPATAAEGRALVAALNEARATEYQSIVAAVRAARAEDAAARQRALRRLRREMRRIRQRDYLAAPERAEAETALEELATLVGTPV
jgi:uncharacterized protein YdbL (DUF1318 family)